MFSCVDWRMVTVDREDVEDRSAREASFNKLDSVAIP